MIVRYSGGRTADDVILTMVDDVRLIDGADGTATLLVVTDDRDLRHGARLARRPDGGVRVAARAARQRAAGVAIDREPATGAVRTGTASGPAPSTSPALSSDGDPAEMDRPAGKPGRGATTKRGNPKKAPKAGRDW